MESKKNFIDYIEKKVESTIKKYKLLQKNDKIAVASSGGKDSTTALYIANKLFPKVDALAIDEGSKGYRHLALESLKKFCSENKIKLKIYYFKEEFGYSLDQLAKKLNENPCTICGAFRRYLINKKAKKYTKVVTGHNLDDESQAILMNFFRGNIEFSARLGPKTGLVKDKRFITRVKPLYFCYEHETIKYTKLKKFPICPCSCPYASTAYRGEVRRLLDCYESIYPGTKLNIINFFLSSSPKIKRYYMTEEKIASCKKCGEPSKQDLCKVCQLITQLK